MPSVQELEKERDQLEAKVVELVDKLESKKNSSEIKLTNEQIIKPRAEQEAAEALEKLELDEAAKAKPTTTAVAGPTEAKKKPDNKGGSGKGKGGAAAAASKEPEKPIDISRLDLRIGKIVEVQKHPDADALYLEKIDCGDPTGPRTVISGLVNHVPIEEMRDRLVVVLCNLKPAKMRGILSEAMVMCASTPEKVELIRPPANVKPGDRLVFEGFVGEPDEQLNPKKKIWEQVAPDIKTNDEGVAVYRSSPFKVAGVEGDFTSNLKNVQVR